MALDWTIRTDGAPLHPEGEPWLAFTTSPDGKTVDVLIMRKRDGLFQVRRRGERIDDFDTMEDAMAVMT